MANKEWRGDAVARAQVDTITIAGTWATNDTATITINTKSLVLTVGATTTTASIATAIKEMINGDAITGNATRSDTGDNIPEFDELTATVNGSVVTVTHDEKGIPFTMTATESTAGDGTATRAASVTPLGPEVYDDANNWALTNAAPVDSDDVYFQNNPDRHAKYNLNQTGIGLESLNIAQDMEAEIGLPRWNANGYFEYRPTYIQGGDAGVTTDINVGKGPGRGSGRIKINTEAGPTILNVFNTGTPIEEGIPALLWKGTEATNVVNVRRGSVGIAIFPGEAATVATLRVGYVDNQESDANVRCGSGVTMGVVTQTGGQTELNAGTSGAVTVTGGRLTVNAGNIAELVVQNATVEYAGVGTLGGTSVKLRENGILDLTNGQGTMTLSNFNMFKGSTLRAPKGRFASAPVIRLNGCTIDDVTVEIEDDFDVDHV